MELIPDDIPIRVETSLNVSWEDVELLELREGDVDLAAIARNDLLDHSGHEVHLVMKPAPADTTAAADTTASTSP